MRSDWGKHRDDLIAPDRTIEAVRSIIASRTSSEWEPILRRADCCCTIVKSVSEALADAQFQARGVFEAQLSSGDGKSNSGDTCTDYQGISRP